MSAIDKLKNSSGIISFDATAPANTSKTVKAGESMDIDMVNGSSDNVSVEKEQPAIEIVAIGLTSSLYTTAIPVEPLSNKLGKAAGKTVGSVVLSL
mgnify:CR=1 FL=1